MGVDASVATNQLLFRIFSISIPVRFKESDH